MVILKWKLLLNLRIAILLSILVLTLILPSTALTSKRFSGTFPTEKIRILWQMCSTNHKMMKFPENIYFPICDCYIDSIRERYLDSSELDNMTKKDGDELAAVLRLSCNRYRN